MTPPLDDHARYFPLGPPERRHTDHRTILCFRCKTPIYCLSPARQRNPRTMYLPTGIYHAHLRVNYYKCHIIFYCTYSASVAQDGFSVPGESACLEVEKVIPAVTTTRRSVAVHGAIVILYETLWRGTTLPRMACLAMSSVWSRSRKLPQPPVLALPP